MNEPLPAPKFDNDSQVYVTWSENTIEKYDTCLLSSLPEVFKIQLCTTRPQESVSLYKCLESFLKEEPLGPEDMDCPSCKKPRQARKKLDLWRIPEILAVHLKRSSCSQFVRNKLETYVDFPIDDFDLSTNISQKKSQFSNHYVLYATSIHHGGMGCGHYNAFSDVSGVHSIYAFSFISIGQETADRAIPQRDTCMRTHLDRLGNRKWYKFVDNRVSPVSEDAVKTSAACVLFCRRVA
ncbi:hypothetical protein SADUNF_Sadunf16G0060900 [Salix dunnii]|uniref:USP domain-containing protein n=1 Tax=Salix dunnii TaxID=1413687 RepID=A0A835MG58_9ROSI|nr:hypothetical protein SADUNF_Sadunf16G0060900 [Salix dunnii]